MKNKTILLVDDDKDDRDLITEAMVRCDSFITIEIATNGQEALEQLDISPLPDLILLDINMPVMDGIECLQRIKQSIKYHTIPVIMYSTAGLSEIRAKCCEMGAADFIIKPTSFKSVCIEIKRVYDTFIVCTAKPIVQ